MISILGGKAIANYQKFGASVDGSTLGEGVLVRPSQVYSLLLAFSLLFSTEFVQAGTGNGPHFFPGNHNQSYSSKYHHMQNPKHRANQGKKERGHTKSNNTAAMVSPK